MPSSSVMSGFGVELLALLERAPQPLVAHDHGVDHAELVEGELILAQDAELRRARDGAPLRRAARRSAAS